MLQSKVCTKCGRRKPLKDFSPNKWHKDGRQSQCKKCHGRHYLPKQKEILPEGFKRCMVCKKVKSLKEFGFDKQNKDRRQGQCKECRKKRRQQRRQENSKKVAEQHARWYQENLERVAEYQRYWRQGNPERVRAKVARYRAVKAGLPATLTSAQWLELLEEWGHCCAYCGKDEGHFGGPLQQEHVIPVIQGGGYTLMNIVPACPQCNFKKGARTPEQAGMDFMPMF